VTHPSQPGITIEATQQVLIDALPPILILHIKRFCYDTTVGGVVKVGKQVLLGPELEIGPGRFFEGSDLFAFVDEVA
jgi:ubiquitin carboxyl-terminal hydrolase 10